MPKKAQVKAEKKKKEHLSLTTYERRTFMFDPQTDEETTMIRRAMRATTASEAVRYAVRKMAEIMVLVKNGGKVYVEQRAGKQARAVVLDIPPAP